MKNIILFGTLFFLIIMETAFISNNLNLDLYPKLNVYSQSAINDFVSISEERKEALKEIASFVGNQTLAKKEAKLIFICTHNSRRSHLTQIWAQVAANYYGLKNVKTYSGGTEATAFNPRAVEALKKVGFKIEKTSEDKNPVYKVKFNDKDSAITAFSKKYDDASNPQTDFCAIMTCSEADKFCPMVKGQSTRLSLPYEDPKAFDGTPEESKMYDERCKQIATEMFYVFSLVKK